MKHFLLDSISSCILGLGCMLLLSPFIFNWFLHGDDTRYLWIINGPPPFNQWGSAPLQLAIEGGLFFTGIVLVVVVIILRKAAH